MSTTRSARAVSSVTRTTMREPSIWSTMPARLAAIAAPLSRATTPSMPVPTNGAAACRSGTAWRCMFEPISARLASSFSRNGISAAATETSCLGETSIMVIASGRTSTNSPFSRAADQLAREAAVGVQLGVGLGDGVAPLLHGREIDDLVGHLAVDDAAIGALDEPVLVDPRVGGEAVDQADVRPFGGLDRADPAVVGRVHVAHLEARPLAGEAARAERRQAALVGDLGERVGLIHELRQLRAAEELAHRRGHRLGVDQVVRHGRVDLDRAHALAHRALHAQQADAELVLHQLADRAHAPVAEMIDVVDLAAAVLDLDQHLDDGDHVLGAQHAQRVLALHAQAHVHLHPADRGEVVALGIEHQAGEQRLGGVQRRRLARAQHPVDVEQRLLAVLAAVERQRVADVGADRQMVDVEHRDRARSPASASLRMASPVSSSPASARTRPVSSLIRSRLR